MAKGCAECGFFAGHAPTCQAAGIDMEYEFAEDPTKPEDTATVLRICVLCTGGVKVYKNDDQQPPERDEAWALGGCHVTKSPRGHHWCQVRGLLWLPEEGMTAEYDRRVSDVLVTHDRRRKRP